MKAKNKKVAGHWQNVHAKNPITFCIECYETEVIFWRYSDTTVQMRCKNCNHFIKWATHEEYDGQKILNEKDMTKPLF